MTATGRFPLRCSLLVAVNRETEPLQHTLGAVRFSLYPNFEVLIVAWGGDDVSADMVRLNYPRARVFDSPATSPGAALAQLAQVASGDVLVLLQPGSILPDRWLADVVAHYLDFRDTAATYAPLLPAAESMDGSPLAQADYRLHAAELPVPLLGAVTVHASAWAAAGGLDASRGHTPSLALADLLRTLEASRYPVTAAGEPVGLRRPWTEDLFLARARERGAVEAWRDYGVRDRSRQLRPGGILGLGGPRGRDRAWAVARHEGYLDGMLRARAADLEGAPPAS